jgi:hypothetical protein
MELPGFQRACKGEMWGGAFDSVGAAIDPAEARYGIFEEILPLVGAATGVDVDYTAGELSVL